MPLVTLTTRLGTPQNVIDSVLDGIQATLVAAGVPATDRFQRVFLLPPEQLKFDSTYPDLQSPRTEKFLLVEITLSVGRTLKLKRQMAAGVVAAAEKVGVSGEDVMVVFNETRWENWSFGGGRFHYT